MKVRCGSLWPNIPIIGDLPNSQGIAGGKSNFQYVMYKHVGLLEIGGFNLHAKSRSSL